MKIALLAGTQSGCGKTTMMLALLQFFQKKNLPVSAFKCGPDFLDPLWHQVVTGFPSYNIDTRMVGVERSRQILAAQAYRVEWALIEGVMGLFDGRSGVGEAGSSADLAHVLNSPVILVVDARGMSGSIVPVVDGFCIHARKKGIVIRGVIANRVGSRHHAELLKTLLSEHSMPPLIAWMTKDAVVLEERHLGLKRPGEEKLPDFGACFHVTDALMPAFSDWEAVAVVEQTDNTRSTGQLTGKTIAIAKDAACCFIYPDNIDWLTKQGARLHFFSVLNGDTLSRGVDALWLPGGYPELYASSVSRSASLTSIRAFIETGKPVLAECGGAMLLGRSLINAEGRSWPMAGVLSFDSRMQNKLVSLGYREEQRGVRGHEFHHSSRESEQDYEPAFNCPRGDSGIRYKNLRASYIHWYFASAPEVVSEWFT